MATSKDRNPSPPDSHNSHSATTPDTELNRSQTQQKFDGCPVEATRTRRQNNNPDSPRQRGGQQHISNPTAQFSGGSQMRQLDPNMFFTFERYTPPLPRQSSKRQLLQTPKRSKPGRYVRAAHRLYVDSSVDVEELWKYPDCSLSWDSVERVDVLCEEASDLLTCPICLDSVFTSPRITQCGHVFCFPCIMRTMDETVRLTQNKCKCPVCGESVQLSHLKPARLQIFKTPKIGNLITMCLIIRESSSSVAKSRLDLHLEHPSISPHQTSPSSNPDLSSQSSLPLLPQAPSQSHCMVSVASPTAYFHRLLPSDPNDSMVEEDLCSLESKRVDCLNLEDGQSVRAIDDCIQFLLPLVGSDTNPHRPSLRSRSKASSLVSPTEYHLLFNFCQFDFDAVVSRLGDFERKKNQEKEKLSEIKKNVVTPEMKRKKNQEKLETADSTNPLSISSPTTNDSIPNMIYGYYQLVDGQFMMLEESCMQCLIKDAIAKRRVTNQHSNNTTIVEPDQESQEQPVIHQAAVVASDVSLSQQSGTLPFIAEDYSCPASSYAYHADIVNSLPSLVKDLPIEWIEERVVDSQFRRRYPVFNFLPSGTSFRFVEVDISPCVSPETFAEFSPMFQRRKANRAIELERKAKIENERALKIEGEQHAQRQLRLLEQQQERRDATNLVDPVTGLRVQAITSDPLSFPPLLGITDGRLTEPGGTPDCPATDWATRTRRPAQERFPTLQDSATSSSAASLSSHRGGGPLKSLPGSKTAPSSYRPVLRVSQSSAAQREPQQKPEPQQQQETRSRFTRRRFRNVDDFIDDDDEAAEYLVSNRPTSNNQNEFHSGNGCQWNAIETALLEAKFQNSPSSGNPGNQLSANSRGRHQKTKGKKIVLSSAPSYRL